MKFLLAQTWSWHKNDRPVSFSQDNAKITCDLGQGGVHQLGKSRRLLDTEYIWLKRDLGENQTALSLISKDSVVIWGTLCQIRGFLEI